MVPVMMELSGIMLIVSLWWAEHTVGNNQGGSEIYEKKHLQLTEPCPVMDIKDIKTFHQSENLDTKTLVQ